MAEYVADAKTTAFGIVQDSAGNGTTALQLRKVLQNHWQSTGIIGTGMSSDQTSHVSGLQGVMQYQVHEGTAVCSYDASDGYTEAYWPDMLTAQVPANDSAWPRIDSIWVFANNPEGGQSDNHVQIGVTVGTPAQNPSAPTVRKGATVIQNMMLPAHATQTKEATPTGDLQYALFHGASMGRLWHLVDYNEHPQQSRHTVFWQPYLFVIERTVELRAYISMSTLNLAAGQGVCAVDFLFDTDKSTVATRKIHYDNSYTTYEFSTIITDIQPGWHHYGLQIAKQTTGVDFQIISGMKSNPGDTWLNQYSGVTFVGIDMGASA